MAPLLFTRRALMAVGIAVGLSACSSHSDIPSFTASGFVADQGVIRLWRKDDEQHRPQVLVSVYSPYRGPGTITTLYTYQGDVLRQIKRNDADGDRDSIQLRFADDGTVSFMQRQLATRREPLTRDEIALYQYQARRILGGANLRRPTHETGAGCRLHRLDREACPQQQPAGERCLAGSARRQRTAAGGERRLLQLGTERRPAIKKAPRCGASRHDLIRSNHLPRAIAR